jgi:hypothetical protein
MKRRFPEAPHHGIRTDVVIPPFVKPDGSIVVRGTKEWDDRERARARAGYSLISLGPISYFDLPRRFKPEGGNEK